MIDDKDDKPTVVWSIQMKMKSCRWREKNFQTCCSFGNFVGDRQVQIPIDQRKNKTKPYLGLLERAIQLAIQIFYDVTYAVYVYMHS
eukprot:scaffold242606_cov61-Attheya_sp.AAC.1